MFYTTKNFFDNNIHTKKYYFCGIRYLKKIWGASLRKTYLFKFNISTHWNDNDSTLDLMKARFYSKSYKPYKRFCVAVIVPVYNTSRTYLNRCMRALLHQSLKNIQIIVVNDGSTNKATLKYLKKLEGMCYKNMTVINQNNLGLSIARNTGIRAADAEYIGFCDSDDYVNKHFYENLYIGCKVTNSDVGCGSLIGFDHKNITFLEKNVTRIAENIAEKFTNVTNGSVCSKLFLSDLFKNVTFPCGVLYEDNIVLVEMFLASKRICFLSDTFYYYRINQLNSIVSDPKKQELRRKSCFTFFETLIKRIKYLKHVEQDLIAFKFYKIFQTYIDYDKDLYSALLKKFQFYDNKYSIKVSVLTPIYNTNLQHLREMIESVLNQTFTDFEFLILNDSPDNTEIEKIVLEYAKHDKRVKYFKNKTNMGISKSRNKLLDLSRGEYIAILDHDDICMSERLEKEVAYLDNHREIGVVGSLMQCFGDRVDVWQNPENDFDIKINLTENCYVAHTSSMIRKSVLIDNSIKYEEFYTPAEDYMLWTQLMEFTCFYNIQEPLVKYRFYSENTSKKLASKMEKAWMRIKTQTCKKHPFYRAEYERRIA